MGPMQGFTEFTGKFSEGRYHLAQGGKITGDVFFLNVWSQHKNGMIEADRII